jgi:acetyl esterase/lipase
MKVSLQFSGPARHRAKSVAVIGRAIADVSLRRALKGPRCASWNLAMEVGTEIAKRQLLAAFAMGNVEEARSYLDSLGLPSPALSRVTTERVVANNLKGTWFVPSKSVVRNRELSKPAVSTTDSGLSILYLHGGGYSFYPRGFYDNLAALIALSADCRLFAAEYRLSPEHKYPAQLEDATHAYRWMLAQGTDPQRLVVLGDSAGGNLTLALLLSLTGLGLPPPALAICLSPATDFVGKEGTTPEFAERDWITLKMALRWADWYCLPEQRSDPLVSPVNADLTHLPPMYVQAGGAEILLPGIEEFVRRARQQGADITMEIWPEMNHDFQAFGDEVPQSVEAIRRIGEVIASRLGRNHGCPVAG